MSEDPYATHPRGLAPMSSSAGPSASETATGLPSVADCFFGAATDTGRQRHNNEDIYLLRPDIGLFGVFDGMGGMAAGELASELARRSFEDFLDTHALLELAPAALLAECARNANRNILAHVGRCPEHTGMGSTVAAVMLHSQTLHVLNLGDSRVYHVAVGGAATPLTRDFSVAAALVESGDLTAREARTCALRNRLTGVLGEPAMARPFETHMSVIPGDRFVLCSDGLWDMLSDAEIGRIARTVHRPDEAARCLIDRANAAGGEDNITVIVIEIGETSHA